MPDVALLISLGSLLVSALAFLVTSVSAYQVSHRAKVVNALEILTADHIAEARFTVGHAARHSDLTAEQKTAFVAAAFRLMWAVQRSAFAARTIRKTALAPQEALWLYRHIDSITADLATAILLHGHEGDWQPTLDYTNDVLKELPKRIKSEWSQLVKKKAFTILEAPKAQIPVVQ